MSNKLTINPLNVQNIERFTEHEQGEKMNPNELTPYGEALEKIIELQDLLIEEQKEVLQLMEEIEALKAKLQLHEAMDNQCASLMQQFRKAQEKLTIIPYH